MEVAERREIFTEMSRIVGVITESFDDKIQLVVEQFLSVHDELHDIRRTLAIHEEKIDRLTVSVVALKQDVTVLKQEVAELKKDVAVLKQDVAELKKDVAVLKQDVAILKQDVTVLKQDVDGLKNDMGEVKTSLAGKANLVDVRELRRA